MDTPSSMDRAIPERSLTKNDRLREGAHEVSSDERQVSEVRKTLKDRKKKNLKEILIHDPGCYKIFIDQKGVKRSDKKLR